MDVFLNGYLTWSIFKIFFNMMEMHIIIVPICYFLITYEVENIWVCLLAFVFSPFVNFFFFTPFDFISHVLINSTNTYGVLLQTK